jgi:hypothetical protein
MQPEINSTSFGSITIAGEKYEYDVVIRQNGEVSKRKKKLSKELYGTSHKISLAEAEHLYTPGMKALLIGSGKFGRVHLSDEAATFFREKQVNVILKATPKAIKVWNQAEGEMVGLFHVTC